MKGWLPVIAVWFLSLFTISLLVFYIAHKEFKKKKRRWKNIKQPFPLWIFPLVVAVVFLLETIFVIVCSSEQNQDSIKTKTWLFFGLLLGVFFVISVLIATLWNKPKWAFSKRTPSDIAHNGLRDTETDPRRVKHSKPSRGQEVRNNEISSKNNPGMDLDPNDEILILRNLSNPNEEFWINLSNSSVPVMTRPHSASNQALRFQTTLPKSAVFTLQNGFTLDVDC